MSITIRFFKAFDLFILQTMSGFSAPVKANCKKRVNAVDIQSENPSIRFICINM